VYSLEPTCRIKNTSNSYYRFLYVRFIDDRSIYEEDLGKIQKDRFIEMKNGQVNSKESSRKKGEEEEEEKHQSCNSIS
jgi:hypothetical protein